MKRRKPGPTLQKSRCFERTQTRSRKPSPERVAQVTPQLYEQDRLSEACGASFATLSEAHEVARAEGRIDAVEQRRLRGVNHQANAAKHCDFGSRGSRV